MGKVKFELNQKGVRELLLSQEMRNVCEEYADAALERLGSGYSANARKGKNRVNVQVQADTSKAKKQNLKENSILKAVYG